MELYKFKFFSYYNSNLTTSSEIFYLDWKNKCFFKLYAANDVTSELKMIAEKNALFSFTAIETPIAILSVDALWICFYELENLFIFRKGLYSGKGVFSYPN